MESGREAELSFYADVYDQRCEGREKRLSENDGMVILIADMTGKEI